MSSTLSECESPALSSCGSTLVALREASSIDRTARTLCFFALVIASLDLFFGRPFPMRSFTALGNSSPVFFPERTARRAPFVALRNVTPSSASRFRTAGADLCLGKRAAIWAQEQSILFPHLHCELKLISRPPRLLAMHGNCRIFECFSVPLTADGLNCMSREPGVQSSSASSFTLEIVELFDFLLGPSAALVRAKVGVRCCC